MSAPSAWQLEQALSIFQSLEAAGQDDTDMAAFEAADLDVRTLLRRAVLAAGEAAAFADAVKARMDDLAIRKKRYEAREDRLRGVILSVMDVLGETSLKEPEFTVTISTAPQGVVVTDAEALPDDLVKITRTPDKTAIKTRLLDKEDVPGAELQNQMPKLTIRTK